MSEFYIHYDSEDAKTILECDCCGYPAPLTDYKGSMDGPAKLCKICYSTFLSKALFYPNQCTDPSLYQSIAYIGNMILDAIEENK